MLTHTLVKRPDLVRMESRPTEAVINFSSSRSSSENKKEATEYDVRIMNEGQ